MKKPAPTDHPINTFSQERWSPRAFSDKPVETQDIASLLECARWAPSAMNEQPWSFLVGQKPDPAWKNLLQTLMEANKIWAEHAPVLILVIGKTDYTHNQRNNDWYAYDTGQAVAHLTVEASRLGLFVHQMAGFSKEKARELFHIPPSHDPLVVMALGHYGDPSILPEELLQREQAPRKRKPLSTFVFTDTFGKSYSL